MRDNNSSYQKKNQFMLRLMILYVPLSLLTPIFMYHLRDTNRLIVIDGRNSYHITEYSEEEKLIRLYEYTAKIAIDALLMRNPNGLDRPELFEAMYIDAAKQTALDQLKLEAEQFQRYEIHQKAEIHKIMVVAADSKKSFVKITGQLVRSFVKEYAPGTYAVDFEATMGLTANYDLGQNALYPFVVSELTCTQSEIKE